MALFGRKQQPSPEPIVDLREPRFEFGYPTTCPECGGGGYLDHIDLVDRVMHQHCPSCWTKWITSERELSSTS